MAPLTNDFKTGTACTMGPWGTVNGVPTMLTAGHCLNAGASTESVSYTLGDGTMTQYESVTTQQAPDGNDVGAMTIPDGLMTSQHYNNAANTQVQQTHSVGTAALNSTVCAARARGYECGTVSYVSSDGHTLYVNTHCQSGDSGTPVYSANGAKFVGELVACNGAGDLAEVFTWASIHKSFPDWQPLLAP